MISVICGTNRPDNQTQIIARHYYKKLVEAGQNVNYFSLQSLPAGFIQDDMYGNRTDAMNKIIKDVFMPAEKLVIVCPEYNGSFPGILKVMIDGIHPQNFYSKKLALVGVSSGRAGNLRGLDHLTNIFNYLQVNVLPYKVPVSQVENLVRDGVLVDEETIKTLDFQIEKFLLF